MISALTRPKPTELVVAETTQGILQADKCYFYVCYYSDSLISGTSSIVETFLLEAKVKLKSQYRPQLPTFFSNPCTCNSPSLYFSVLLFRKLVRM